MDDLLGVSIKNTENICYEIDYNKGNVKVYRVSDKHNPIYTRSINEFVRGIMDHFDVKNITEV